jgi:DNA-binding NarL/FixJ family response regulator
MEDDTNALTRCLATGNGASVEAAAAATQRRRRQLLYIDAHHLTRDCIGREVARYLPDVSVVVRARVQDIDLVSPDGSKFDAVVINAHADKVGAGADRPNNEMGLLVEELLLLELRTPETPRILLSDSEAPEDIIEAFQRRIRGYLPTSLPIGQVAEAIKFVLAGGTFVPQSILTKYKRPELSDLPPQEDISPAIASFSPRQMEVLSSLWRGLSNKMIAYELRMCESTVKVHIRHIMKKLNVNNRTQVVLRTRRPPAASALQFDRPDLRRTLPMIALADPIPPERAGAAVNRGVALLAK